MSIRRTEEEWFELVEGFDNGVMSIEEYCELNNMSQASYYVYKRKLKRRNEMFLPIVFEEEIKEDTLYFEVNGYKLEVNDTISESLLKKIIRATRDDN